MGKKKTNNADFMEIRLFTNGIKENEIKLPKSAIKPINKLNLKDKASMRVFLIDKEYADILNAKL